MVFQDYLRLCCLRVVASDATARSERGTKNFY